MICKKYIYGLILFLIILFVVGCSDNIDNTTKNQTDLQGVSPENKGIINLTYTLNDKQVLNILNKIKEDYILLKYGKDYDIDLITTKFNNEQFKTDNISIDICLDIDIKLKSKQNADGSNHKGEIEITAFLYRLEVENIINNDKVTDELQYNIYATDGIGNKSNTLLTGKLNRQIVEENIKHTSNLCIHFDKSIKSLNIDQAEIIAKDIKEMYVRHFDKNVHKLENFNYEFNTEKDSTKQTVDVDVYFDITLIRHPLDSPFVLGMKKAISELNDKDKIEIAEETMDGWLKELMPEYNVKERIVLSLKLQINDDKSDVLKYNLFYSYVLEGKTTLYPAKEYYESRNKTEQVDITNNNQGNTTIEIQDVDSNSYDKIAEYLQKQADNVFSPYYQLLGFEVVDYEETVEDYTVEAILKCTITYKNYDKDPDTVEFIKKAKENNDYYYKTYYDEYLESKDMNMEIKAIIDKEGVITLWTDNDPTQNREWAKFEMSDCIIGR